VCHHLPRDQLTRDELMSKRLDLTGQRFGRLTVLEELGTRRFASGQSTKMWRCLCTCGRSAVVQQSSLTSGNTKSCGCLGRERRGATSKTHGMSRTAEYKIWCKMKARCLSPAGKHWADYGGRGIKVCARWLNSFEAFYEDMGARPSTSHSIDRINVDGHYEPGNCRWATPYQQTRNKRSNVWVDVNGKRLCMADATKALGVGASCLYQRRHRARAKQSGKN
jgi:hypothetical protein